MGTKAESLPWAQLPLSRRRWWRSGHRELDGTERAAAPPVAWRPGVGAFLLVYLTLVVVGLLFWRREAQPGAVAWYTTVVWTLPLVVSVQGLAGGLLTLKRSRHWRGGSPGTAVVPELLVVVVPTIGRLDTFPALERVLGSFGRHLPRRFPRFRVDIVVEEGCEADDPIARLVEADTRLRVVTVPRSYRTPNGTRFKARANHYAAVLREAEGQATDDVWVLHMDDDTGVGPDTVESMAQFVHAQRSAGPDRKHLAQGVLSYPREHASARLLWMADAVRPGCDISLFAFSTARGTPRTGLHGELLLVRASVEAEIGWDFGPRTIVEDAQFALHFSDRYPGRSAWFPGCSYGAPPSTVADFVRQRERWVWGLLELVVNRDVPPARRRRLALNVLVWAFGPIQHPAVILVAAMLLGDFDTAPVSIVLLPVCALNLAFCVWLYWEGLKVNARASALPRRLWWEPFCLAALVPLFTLWEAVGILCGVARFVGRGPSTFRVIAKPV